MSSPFDPTQIHRPAHSLLHYYVYVALLSGPLFPFILVPYWMRYATLRYKFDDEGVSMSWGVIFRREVNLTYRRIQDIHFTRNIFQRWMGLATISLQTASGNANAEMTIEGILQAEELRDYLYVRMRGAHDSSQEMSEAAGANVIASPLKMQSHDSTQPEADVLQTLVEIRDALKILVERSQGDQS